MAQTMGGAGLAPVLSRGSGHNLFHTLSSTIDRQKAEKEDFDDSPDDTDASSDSMQKGNDWKMLEEVRAIQQQAEKDNFKNRKLGVTWKNLTVKGIGSDSAFHENVVSQFNVPQLVKESREPANLRTLVDDSFGCVKPGEMLLVLGRPGAGCTTLLKMLSNRRTGYAEVTGDVHFGTMDEKEAKQYRGQITMNTEEELFYPTLTVGRTLDFATRMKIPFHIPSDVSSPKDYQQKHKDFLLRAMNIPHTNDTKVGNEYVRGVSGGERKRVSILEVLATRSSVYTWDNSTRGLDASTALEYAKALRAMTDEFGLATIVTLYQAGNGIYNQFDKVLVLEEGRQIYYGGKDGARPFMEELGFLCDESANVGDFLTGVTVPTERQIREGYEDRFPRTADAIRDAYKSTAAYEKMSAELDYPTSEQAKIWTEEFKTAINFDKAKGLPKKSPLTVAPHVQVRAAITRQYQIIWGDKATFTIKQGSTIAQALIAGSLFYNAPGNSSGLFLKGGALFFSLLFNSLLAMSEVTDSFAGRPVLAKHRSFALYHPAAFCIAQICADIPVLLFQVSTFSVVIYFMVGLRTTAAGFFTYWIVVFSATMVMTAFFRAVGAMFSTFDAASKVSGLMLSVVVMYTGYLIPFPSMHPWFKWIFWVNPLAYGFEALLANELHHQIVPCVDSDLIPNGPGYTNAAYQSCGAVSGRVAYETSLTGDQYLHALSYSHGHVWRNFGILWAWWALFAALTIIFTSRWQQSSGNSGFLVIPRENTKKNAHLVNDEEAQASQTTLAAGRAEEKDDDDIEHQLVRNTSIFTWRNLTYTVKTPTGDRVLLDDVQGWVKPGMLGALMGSSGAGKTTLLDVLAQRKTDGTIHGEILVDGRPLSLAFQRSAGYCEQLDVHEPMATVREALEFSALLRQSRETPDAEKLAYVDTIVNLLEMHDIEHTLIGKTGAGLSIEQRKRLTIGVELVSKPSILIFLDEPTSGLDGQAAFNTVRFLRKLADVGQAVLVTVHQPSASLFAQFDTLLLLARGGKTVYFGEIGDKAKTIRDYFGRYDAPCPDHVNPAEFMIDVVSGTLSQGKDWNKVWLESPEHDFTIKELGRMIDDAAAKPPGTTDDGHEFATSLMTQCKLVTHRMNMSLYRNTDYANNKFMLHIASALFNGFTYWMIKESIGDLQLRLFANFNFIFVAPGVINQLQPLFIERRDIFEVREKKSKMYSWKAFTTALIVSEVPYLCVCAVLYFVCFYYTVGFPKDSNKSGAVFFIMLFYEFVYTGIGQFIAAYAPNATAASLVNPVVIGTLVSFCGVLVPYAQLQVFWRYWMYYINPFNYLMGGLLVFSTYGATVRCKESEFAIFNPPSGETCGTYLTAYLADEGSRTNLTNPDATSGCKVCQYRTGADYLYTLNLDHYYDGWRDAAIVVIFAISSYAMVFLCMKLRTKQSKTAS